MEKIKLRSGLQFQVAVLCLAAVFAAAEESSLAAKCSAQFQKVTQCLPFATAKVAAPSKECCDSVAGLRESDPACLCFIIQQIHNGSSPAVRSMGVQETRLLQLPSACRLANASIAECPRLLHMPPNSPDATIFTNASSAVSTTPNSAPSVSSPTSDGFMQKPRLWKYCIVTFVSVIIIPIFLLFRALPLLS